MTMGRTKSKKPAIPLKTKLKKDPGVPRLPLLKEKVRDHEKRKARRISTIHRLDPDSIMASEPTPSTLASQAQAIEVPLESYATDSFSSVNANEKSKELVRKYYLRALHKVIDQSDIVILVLDARDPEGTRSRLVEEEVRRRETEGKKLVFVLNKIDLVPRSNAQLWLKHLRHTTPTLPFLSKSTSQRQRINISSSTAPALLKLLKAYKPKAGSVTIGVVGYPNVGKSSLINSLKRAKVCAVASQPGHTKELQSVQLERGMRIVDSPGVVFDDKLEDGKGLSRSNILLRNVMKVEDIGDPIAVVEEILGRTSIETLQKIYNLPYWSSILEFLTMLAMKGGRLLGGGTPDIDSAARMVLQDWNHQKIPYFSDPPVLHPSHIPSTVPSSLGPLKAAPGAENVGQAQILDAFSKPFELEGLFVAADAGAFGEQSTDILMGAEVDEDGDVFFDAVEDDIGDTAMNNTDQSVLISTNSSPVNSRKRPRSPSVTLEVEGIHMSGTSMTSPPKRPRKSRDVPSYDAPIDEHILNRMARGNPLSRRNLKREAKRVRRAQQVRNRRDNCVMEVDVGDLGSTFMA